MFYRRQSPVRSDAFGHELFSMCHAFDDYFLWPFNTQGGAGLTEGNSRRIVGPSKHGIFQVLGQSGSYSLLERLGELFCPSDLAARVYNAAPVSVIKGYVVH